MGAHPLNEHRIDRKKFILRLFKLLSIGSFIVSAALLVVVIIMQFPGPQARYEKYLQFYVDFEAKIGALGNKWLLLIVIVLLYVMRSLTPAYPFMALYIITGMVFPPRWSLLINILGMLFNIAFRYYTGMVMGGSWLNRVLNRNPIVWAGFEAERANPWVLFGLRFVPFFPFATVSQLYGSSGYPFWKYLVISIVAISPRLVTYSYLGRYAYDPLSTRMLILIIALTVLSGLSSLTVRFVLGITFKHSRKKKGREKDEQSPADESPDP